MVTLKLPLSIFTQKKTTKLQWPNMSQTSLRQKEWKYKENMLRHRHKCCKGVKTQSYLCWYSTHTHTHIQTHTHRHTHTLTLTHSHILFMNILNNIIFLLLYICLFCYLFYLLQKLRVSIHFGTTKMTEQNPTISQSTVSNVKRRIEGIMYHYQSHMRRMALTALAMPCN